MKLKPYWKLIDNFTQCCKEFETLEELKEYVRKTGWKSKKCDFSERWFYLDNAY